MRADPVPASPTDGGPLRFAFGDVGNLVRLLLPLALEPADLHFATTPFVVDTLADHPEMTLWPLLAAPGNRLRLRWDTVRAAAVADVARVRRLLAPGQPTLHRYYAILDSAAAPLDRPRQVVRRSGHPTGHPVDEHLGPDGGWRRSHLLDDIHRGRTDGEERLLRPEEVDRCIAAVRARWRG